MGGRAGAMLLTNLVSGWGGLKNTFASQAHVDPELFDRIFQALPGEWEENHSMYEYVIAMGQVSPERKGTGTLGSTSTTGVFGSMSPKRGTGILGSTSSTGVLGSTPPKRR